MAVFAKNINIQCSNLPSNLCQFSNWLILSLDLVHRSVGLRSKKLAKCLSRLLRTKTTTFSHGIFRVIEIYSVLFSVILFILL